MKSRACYNVIMQFYFQQRQKRQNFRNAYEKIHYTWLYCNTSFFFFFVSALFLMSPTVESPRVCYYKKWSSDQYNIRSYNDRK